MAMGHMTLRENTLPMMMGAGQLGPVEMGGMFTTMKIRDGLAQTLKFGIELPGGMFGTHWHHRRLIGHSLKLGSTVYMQNVTQ